MSSRSELTNSYSLIALSSLNNKYYEAFNNQKMYNDDMSLLYENFDSYWYATVLKTFLEPNFLNSTIKISEKEFKSCSICLDTFNDKNNTLTNQCIKIKKCGHIFHLNCFKKWLRYNKTCPLCRTPI